MPWYALLMSFHLMQQSNCCLYLLYYHMKCLYFNYICEFSHFCQKPGMKAGNRRPAMGHGTLPRELRFAVKILYGLCLRIFYA